eukprot:3703908-Rhodomonas_salina.1
MIKGDDPDRASRETVAPGLGTIIIIIIKLRRTEHRAAPPSLEARCKVKTLVGAGASITGDDSKHVRASERSLVWDRASRATTQSTCGPGNDRESTMRDGDARWCHIKSDVSKHVWPWETIEGGCKEEE